uniref:Uncharacterized protein n=1 Tax=Clandestinovirus TaxID=2831644 RepID=A0A8F8PMH8_9VIRU|nr:hypothetical protein KOM_12_276 [Clandestinovirus]
MLAKNLTIHERRVSAVTIVLSKYRDSFVKSKNVDLALKDHKALLAPFVVESLRLSEADKAKIANYRHFIVRLPGVNPSRYCLLYAMNGRMQVVSGSMYENPSKPSTMDSKLIIGDLSKILTGSDQPAIDYHYVEPLEFIQWSASGPWQKGLLILVSMAIKYTLNFSDVARFMLEVRRNPVSSDVIGTLLESMGNGLTTVLVAPSSTAPLAVMKPSSAEKLTENPTFVQRLAQTLSIHPDQFVDPSKNLTLGEMPYEDMKEFLFQGIKPKPTLRGMLHIKQLPYSTVEKNASADVVMADPNAYTKRNDVISVSTLKKVYDRLAAKHGQSFTSIAGSKESFVAKLLI